MRPVRAAIASLTVSAALLFAAAPRLYLASQPDQLAFRRWFTFLAESRYYTHKPLREIDTCAALVRWSFREALLPHNAHWARATELPLFPAMPSVQEITPGDVSFPDATAIQRNETWFVSRDLSSAQPGDLLFFKTGPAAPEHVMIYIGRSQIVPSARQWIVYVSDSGRKVERASVEDTLASWPAEWKAAPRNSSFLGVWRFNILHGAE